jgi:outer membrane protein, heavy metal efflux system
MSKYLITIPLLWLHFAGFAQKALTLEQCEAQFLKKNLVLLAAQYNIDAAKALTIQAKLWENPYFSMDFNAINPQDKTVLDIGGKGQKGFSIQQLIYLGSKKKNQIELAKTNEQLTALDLQDLLRNLKYQLRKSFYTIYFNQKKLETNDAQIAHIETLVQSYAIQAQKGNIALKELVRLQSLLLNFKNARMEIVNSNLEEQANLHLLMGETEMIQPISDENVFNRYTSVSLPDKAALDSLAWNSRPDYLLNRKKIESNEWNVKWQKSLAIPDLTVGMNYDQRGGAFSNQINFSVGIPIPVFNKNQGNIQYAAVILKQSQAEQQSIAWRLQAEVAAGLLKWRTAKENYTQLSATTIADFEAVYNGVLQNFQKRNIGILEFTDFMESYNQMSIQLSEYKKNVVLSGESLHAILNSKIF